MDRGEEHQEEGGQILARGRGAGYNRARVIVENGNDVDGLVGVLRHLMVFDVTDIDRPILV